MQRHLEQRCNDMAGSDNRYQNVNLKLQLTKASPSLSVSIFTCANWSTRAMQRNGGFSHRSIGQVWYTLGICAWTGESGKGGRGHSTEISSTKWSRCL